MEILHPIRHLLMINVNQDTSLFDTSTGDIIYDMCDLQIVLQKDALTVIKISQNGKEVILYEHINLMLESAALELIIGFTSDCLQIKLCCKTCHTTLFQKSAMIIGLSSYFNGMGGLHAIPLAFVSDETCVKWFDLCAQNT
jgi:hypothetical protein